MKHLFVLLLLVSCGKNVTKTRFIENKFDDTTIQNQLTAHEARIKALEDAQQGFLVQDDIKDFLTGSEIDAKLTVIETLATKSELMEIKSICGTKEQLIKSGSKLFAVMSTIVSVNSKNLASNIHLGEITDGSYKLTDGSNVTFSVVNGKVVNCSNSTK